MNFNRVNWTEGIPFERTYLTFKRLALNNEELEQFIT